MFVRTYLRTAIEAARAADAAMRGTKEGAADSGTADSGSGAMLVFKNSFVAHRVSADGKTTGPKALFSRYNVSIQIVFNKSQK